MSAKAGSGVSVMRSDLDASTSTEVDAHEAQWRAGVNRQARPDAPSQRLAHLDVIEFQKRGLPHCHIAQSVIARAAAGGAISTHSRHRCTCVLPLPPNSAPLSSTRAHPIICSQADCGVCCAVPTHQTLARA